jgi:hypothetical protein
MEVVQFISPNDSRLLGHLVSAISDDFVRLARHSSMKRPNQPSLASVSNKLFYRSIQKLNAALDLREIGCIRPLRRTSEFYYSKECPSRLTGYLGRRQRLGCSFLTGFAVTVYRHPTEPIGIKQSPSRTSNELVGMPV